MIWVKKFLAEEENKGESFLIKGWWVEGILLTLNWWRPNTMLVIPDGAYHVLNFYSSNVAFMYSNPILMIKIVIKPIGHM